MADNTLDLLGADPEVLGLQRQRQLANLLTGQAFNQPQGQMISGHYVKPSALQQALPMINAAIGGLTNANLDTKQQELAAALRGKQAEIAQRFASGTPQEKLAAALDPNAPAMIKAAASEMFKTQKAGKGDIISQMNFNTGKFEPILEGAPDIPDVLQYAISVGGLPQNPATWNDQQRAYAKQLVESKARASAGNVYNQMGKSIAGEVGPIMKELQGNVQAAVKTEDFANNIIKAVDSNKLYTGTGANVRLGAAQVADTIGVGGKDLQTKIANTRQTMQGLAQLTLQGRQQMRGQGAITENESKLAERAISGDITFTPTEIKQLANAAKRSAEYTYNNYQTKLGEMAKNPETAGLVPYYQIPRMTQPTMTETNDTSGWSVKKVQ